MLMDSMKVAKKRGHRKTNCSPESEPLVSLEVTEKKIAQQTYWELVSRTGVGKHGRRKTYS